MTTYTFDTTVPAANNAPRNDQPVMQTNNASTSGLIGVDHVGFNVTNGGAHKQVQLLNAAGIDGAIPAGLLGNGYETLYSSATAGAGELWMVRGNSPTGIQLTGPGDPIVTPGSFTGVSFLPGGLVIQFGYQSMGGGNSQHRSLSTNFTSPFPNNCLHVQLTMEASGASQTSSDNTFSVVNFNATAFQWLYNGSGTANYPNFYWLAIGY